ncbi:MAG: recombinase family protein, partial [Bacteroidetes bacterium]|nr:recombinase family protein [Bacteroidota bacterium]
MLKRGIEALLALLRGYQTGGHSYQGLAEQLNAQGYRNREGKPFTKGSVEHVLGNRFYQGKAVYHPGKVDEEILEGEHEVPEEVAALWLQCQQVKLARNAWKEGRPRIPARSYPFTGVAICDGCRLPYTGQPAHRRNGGVVRRLTHKRPFCEMKPHSVRVERLMSQ